MAGTPRTDVVCLGESMVTFLPSRPGRLADVPSFTRAIGGAESNVACALARMGHRTAWVGRVGTDGFGDHLLAAMAEYGVDVSGVTRDPRRPTGIYFRTRGERSTTAGGPRADGVPLAEVAYYRAGSAASAMSPGTTGADGAPPAPATVDLDAARSGRILHTSGITPALSADCLALMRTLHAPGPGRPLVSFDLNHRAALWENAPAGPDVLLELARGADLVFAGEDEAEEAWGLTGGPAALRAALPEPSVLVVKQGSRGAVAHARTADGGDETVAVPAPHVDVVASVGAGDAFAAGFLSAGLRRLPLRARLRHGHLAAAAALTDPGDIAAPPGRARADSLAALDDAAWETLRLGPGWTTAPGDTAAAADPGPAAADGERAQKASTP